ncbi:response regulator [Candidatus Chloroploca sp. Khr17]|uniref:response regulator n=1 Tax=Candidatus Chloroploca sp. Khr17 TaxID=2496869 RepID=UPI00101BB81F|nr:response regulator [Candidatus Chloroploca sp. Khr17]
MKATPPELDRLTHALMSPLTTLQGTVQLLQRRLSNTPDEQQALLLAALGRNVQRLRTVCDLLLQSAFFDGTHLQICVLPEDLAHHSAASTTTTHQDQPVAPAQAGQPLGETVTSRGHQCVLVIAAATSGAALLLPLLRERGFTVELIETTTRGIDRAREVRPALVLVDPHVDHEAEIALQILSEDPETKGIVLAVLSKEFHWTGTRHPFIIDPMLAPEQAVPLLTQHLSPSENPLHSRQRILIVDDEPDIAMMIAAQFERDGFQTTQVHSGTEVLQIVREQRFDLILLDVMLPDIDGFTALGGLRAQAETQLTPIILLSAINSPMEKVRGLELGADDYITKPFSAAELSARVQAAMRRSEREGGANPSTRLPGNIAIERAISQRIDQGLPFAVGYCDLDNFKAYNDRYGFLKGDAVILRTAQILLDAIRTMGNPDDFVGHIGGDDFVVISTPDRIEAICSTAVARFDATAPFFYDPATRQRGFISGVDRQGQPTSFPLASITITIISSARHTFRHPGEVAQRSAEGKKRGKQIPGSVYLLHE